MSLTRSTMLALGTTAPNFDLPNVANSERVKLSSFDESDALLVMFISRHCPYVQHVKAELAQIGLDYEGKGLAIVAISSNDVVSYPDDSPQKLRELAEQVGFRFPLLYDESQEVAKSYSAACTPDFFLFDRDRTLVYRGQLDDSRPGKGVPVDGSDLRRAIDAALAGKPVERSQKPSMGCNIKWRQDNAPSYFSS